MDELEIDGKKYFSSKRAAKEHKYHIDYIGQLIRAGKVAGKKVGRSWYVDAASLKNYLAQEADGGAAVATATEPVAEVETQEVATEAESVPEAVIETPAPVAMHPLAAEKKVEPQVVPHILHAAAEPEVSRKVYFSTPEKEPEQKATLTYVEDDEPMLPVLNGRMRANADFVVPLRREARQVVEEAVAEEQTYEEEEVQETPAARPNQFTKPFLVIAVVIGIMLIATVAAGSSLLATSIKVHEGQPASVGVTIK